MAELHGADKLARCNVLDCRPPQEPEPATVIPKQAQVMDYMAKDYDSFLRAMLDLLPARLPGWKDRTEADLGMAVLELFAYLGDQLSYYQDRVANEAFLPSAVQYESVRKLLSLIDYRLHPGAAARTLLAFEVSALFPAVYLAKAFPVKTESSNDLPEIVFETDEARTLYPELNSIALNVDAPSNASGDEIELAAELDESYWPSGAWLLLHSDTGQEWSQVQSVAVDTILHTTKVTLKAPLGSQYPAATSAVKGNGVRASHGEHRSENTKGAGLPDQRFDLDFAPLTYVTDENGDGRSSLQVQVDNKLWKEVEDFISSDATDQHYRISRGNDGYVTVHFGDGVHGRIPDKDVEIEIDYRIGIGEAGLVAANTLTEFIDATGAISKVTNPLPSDSAREPESLVKGKLLGPRNIKQQNRAVIPQDYERLLLKGVSVNKELLTPLHVKAYYRWTGSWTTVFISVDMPERGLIGHDEWKTISKAFEDTVKQEKLAGYDVKVVKARYAPVRISLIVHVKPEFFARHVREDLEKVLGNKKHADGTFGFFAPESFGFGEDVYLSDLYAAAMTVNGVQSLEVTRFKRLGDRYPDREQQGYIEIHPLEIARCDSDPLHPENGLLYIRTCGGKEG